MIFGKTSPFLAAQGQKELLKEFFDAVDAGDIPSVARMLAESPALISERDDFRKTALMRAMLCRKPDMALYLIEAGVDIETCDNALMRAVHYAAEMKDSRPLQTLIEKKARLEAGGAETSPLHMAAYWGRLENVSLLVKAGAELEARNEKGKTPLMYAAGEDMLDIAEILLKAGADPEAKGPGGRNSFDYAEEVGNLQGFQGRVDHVRYGAFRQGLSKPLRISPPFKLRKPSGP